MHLPALLMLLAEVSIHSTAPPAAPTPSNSFAAQVDPALVASNAACAAAVAQVQSDPLVTHCFGVHTSLLFATQTMVCDGEAYPGAPHRNPRCLAATVGAARLVSDKCAVGNAGDQLGKEMVYKAWSNRAAARDACTQLPDPLVDPPASTATSHAIFQVYQSFNVWRNWKWDASAAKVTSTEKRKVLCTPANKVYWRNVKAVGEQPAVYFMVLGDVAEVGEYVGEVAEVCGFKVPAVNKA